MIQSLKLAIMAAAIGLSCGAGLDSHAQLFGLFGEATLDGTNDESLKESIKAMMEEMEEEDRRTFQRDLMAITIDAMSSREESEGECTGGLETLFKIGMAADNDGGLNAATEVAVSMALDGLTAAQVRANAQVIRDRDALCAAQRKAEKQAAEEQKRQAEVAAQATLTTDYLFSATNFRVKSYEFISEKSAMTDVTIHNKGDRALAGVTYRAELRTPGRAIPWVEDEMQVWFDGGVEPGETRVEEAYLSDAFEKDVRDDAVFSAELMCVWGPKNDENRHLPLAAARGCPPAILRW